MCLDLFSIFFSITQFSNFWVMSYDNWKRILGVFKLWKTKKRILGVFKLWKTKLCGIFVILLDKMGPTYALSHQSDFVSMFSPLLCLLCFFFFFPSSNTQLSSPLFTGPPQTHNSLPHEHHMPPPQTHNSLPPRASPDLKTQMPKT